MTGQPDGDLPRLFISYSWTTPEHEAWVLKLVEARDHAIVRTVQLFACFPIRSGGNLRVESVLGFRFVVSRVSLAHANRNFDCRLGI